MVNSHLHLEIEATNYCNTRCIHCAHSALKRPSGKMNVQTFQVIMDKAMAYTTDFCVVFCGLGEPLLNPNIYKFIPYVAHQGRTSLITNGSELTPENLERLIDAGLDQITISFNGGEKVLYELMMGGLDFKRGQYHLRKAVELSQGTQTMIAANVSVTRQTQEYLVAIKDYLTTIGIQTIYFSKCHNRGGFLIGDRVCDTPLPPADQERCDLFRNILFVSWTGEALSCYHDLTGTNKLGDLRAESIQTILDRKTAIITAGIPFAICTKCNDFYRFCDDRTPDGRPLSDWVFDLYTKDNLEVPPGGSSINQWLSVINKKRKQKQ